MKNNKITLKMAGKKIIVDYNILGLKQVILFLQEEQKNLIPAKKKTMKFSAVEVKQ
jgi:hypothetical protein